MDKFESRIDDVLNLERLKQHLRSPSFKQDLSPLRLSTCLKCVGQQKVNIYIRVECSLPGTLDGLTNISLVSI